jgi:hypothetical protein
MLVLAENAAARHFKIAVMAAATVPSVKCPKCNKDIDFHRTNCAVCGSFVGYPNVRIAAAMKHDLNRHYAEALSDATRRGVRLWVNQLEVLLDGSVATITVRPNILSNMAVGHNYRNYYKALKNDLRRIAEPEYHAHRAAVDVKIHPGYETEILDAALSPDGRGLTSYGEITLQLRNVTIEDRASVLRENSFTFYERYDLGKRDAKEEPGWRSVWADRAHLGIAHLAGRVTPTTSERDLPGKILSSGATRNDDCFMEIHIYGELTLDAVDTVSLDKPLTNANDHDDWDFARQKVARKLIAVVDRTGP